MKMSQSNQEAVPTKAAVTAVALNDDESVSSATSSATSACRTSTTSTTSTASTMHLFKSSRATVAVAALLMAIILCGGNFGFADGLKCHMCGQYNEGVGSITPCTNYTKDIAHLYLKECTKKSEKYCVKYVSELSTVRDCATECVEKEIWETQTYCCTEDGCNSATQFAYSTLLLILPLMSIIWPTLVNRFNGRR
ncbi:uncharacterized protein [Drosophila tropicalis]|uniref:uncharacterized protein n=1 Tax=Drosophila tropicalis TaxID=46794 RepID=UPI0035AB7836